MYPILLEADTGLTTLGQVFTQFTTWISSLITTISSSAILMLAVGITCVSAVIGLAHKLIRG